MRFKPDKLYPIRGFTIKYGPLNHEEAVDLFDNRTHGVAADFVLACHFGNLKTVENACQKGHDLIRIGGGLWEAKTYSLNGADLQPSYAKGVGRGKLDAKKFTEICKPLEGFILVDTSHLINKVLFIKGVTTKNMLTSNLFSPTGKLSFNKGEKFFGENRK